MRRLGRCGRYWERDVEVDIVCVEEGHVTAVEVKWSDLDEGEAEAVIRDVRRKLGREGGDYYVAVRRGPKKPPRGHRRGHLWKKRGVITRMW